MRHLLAVLLLVVALPTMVACGEASEDRVATEATEATTTAGGTEATTTAGGTVYTEDTTTIETVSGDTFTIELPITPGTGYRWVPSMPMGYVQLGNEIVPTEGDAVGQPTVERWQLSVDAPGSGQMTFDLVPPGSDTPERTVTFDVTAS